MYKCNVKMPTYMCLLAVASIYRAEEYINTDYKIYVNKDIDSTITISTSTT